MKRAFCLRIFSELSLFENQFQKAKKRQRTNTLNAPRFLPKGEFAPVPLGPGRSAPGPVSDVKEAAKEMRNQDAQNLVGGEGCCVKGECCT